MRASNCPLAFTDSLPYLADPSSTHQRTYLLRTNDDDIYGYWSKDGASVSALPPLKMV